MGVANLIDFSAERKEEWETYDQSYLYANTRENELAREWKAAQFTKPSINESF